MGHSPFLTSSVTLGNSPYLSETLFHAWENGGACKELSKDSVTDSYSYYYYQIKGDRPENHLAECLAHSKYLVHESYGHHPPLTLCKRLVKGLRTRRKVALLITQTSLQPEGELQSMGRPVVRARQAHRVLGVWGQNQEISELSMKNRVRLVEWESR